MKIVYYKYLVRANFQPFIVIFTSSKNIICTNTKFKYSIYIFYTGCSNLGYFDINTFTN